MAINGSGKVVDPAVDGEHGDYSGVRKHVVGFKVFPRCFRPPLTTWLSSLHYRHYDSSFPLFMK
jgi:hypothetical protein